MLGNKHTWASSRGPCGRRPRGRHLFKKFVDRADVWGKLGVGLLQSMLAYQVYVSSVVMFVAQLLPLPAAFQGIEEKACSLLCRGPKDWITAAALKDLQALHFPRSLPDVPSAALAARARVARFENAAHGGLKVHARARKMRRLAERPENQHRVERFRA